MTPIKRALFVMLFVLGGLTGMAAKASATDELFWHCRTCVIPETCYPGGVCQYGASGPSCYSGFPSCTAP